jgi:hypothetical protein
MPKGNPAAYKKFGDPKSGLKPGAKKPMKKPRGK